MTYFKVVYQHKEKVKNTRTLLQTQAYILVLYIQYNMANEPMKRVPKMARENISLAHGTHCCPTLLFILPDQRLFVVKNTCIYTHI